MTTIPATSAKSGHFQLSPDFFSACDILLHAAQGRLTSGLSPIGSWLAALDAAAHGLNAPFRTLGLMWEGILQWPSFAAAMAAGVPAIAAPCSDHRFSDPAWQALPFLAFQQSFLMVEAWAMQIVTPEQGVSNEHQRIVRFAARQMLDIVSPSNVPWMNPEVLRATAQTGGTNLADGVRHLAADTLAAVLATDSARLQLGKNMAASPGRVVLRNALMELIQYSPATGEVRPEPILIVPAWIMKYYILDLTPNASLIGYLVDQGFTVFAISWRNPGAEASETTLDAYRVQGFMAALDAATQICSAPRVHACGYCLGGTLLAISAAAMARDRDPRLASVTLLAAQTDFTEAGELQLFINEDQLAFLSDIMQTQGYLDSTQMAGAFQILRSNDLIWSRAISRYLLGRDDTPTELALWNQDGTRMPARMHAEYLRRLFLDNELAEGRFRVGAASIALEDIAVPFFVVGTEADHIAPWRSVYKLHLFNPGEITFILTSGGHNAGIVSEPGHLHRHFRLAIRRQGDLHRGPDQWIAEAAPQNGSWWPEWGAWLAQRSGPFCPPPRLGSAAYPALDPAPGRYIYEP